MSRQMKIRFAVMVAVCVGVVSFSTVFGLVRDVTAWLSGFSQQRRSTDKVVDVMPVLSVTTGFNTFCLAEPEQSHLAAATSKGVFQIELSKQEVVKVGDVHKDAVYAVIAANDGITTASWDKTVTLTDWPTGKVHRRYQGTCSTGFGRCAITADGKRLVVCSSDRPAYAVVLDATTLTEQGSLGGESAFQSICCHPTDDVVALGNLTGDVYFFRCSDRRRLHHMNVGKNLYVEALNYRPDGSTLAYGLSDGTLGLVDVDYKAEVISDAHPGGINALLFSPDGNYLFVGYGDTGRNDARDNNLLSCWDLQRKRRINVPVPADGVVQSIVCAKRNTLVVVATSTGSVLAYELKDIMAKFE